jgi:hypothetical protein
MEISFRKSPSGINPLIENLVYNSPNVLPIYFSGSKTAKNELSLVLLN